MRGPVNTIAETIDSDKKKWLPDTIIISDTQRAIV